MTKLEKLMQLNGIKSLYDLTATNVELENALMEIAQNQSDLEDALVELAQLLTEEE